MASLTRLASLFHSVRFWLLAGLVASAAAACATQPQSPILFLAAAAGWAIAFAGLRQLPFAGAVACAPLPALLWFADGRHDFAFAVSLPQGLIGFTADPYPLLFAAAILMGMGAARRLLEGAGKDDALAGALEALPAILSMVVFASAGLFGEAALPLVAGGISVVVAVPAATATLRFGERFYFSANRAREIWARALEPLFRLSEARWAFSLSGVALVLAVLAGFDGENNLIGRLVAGWSGPLISVLAILLAGRDPRAALGGLASSLLLMAFGGLTLMGPSLFVLFSVQLVRAARPQPDGGTDIPRAWSRALEREAPALIVAGFGAALTGFALDGMPVALEILRSGAVALILFPALSLALHHLLPRRRSLKELYRG